MTDTTSTSPLRIGTIGSGAIARALATPLAARGHTILIGGRTPAHARETAHAIGHGAVAVDLADAVRDVDAVLLAVPWTATEEVLTRLGADHGSLAGVVVVDPTNPVSHGIGAHQLESGSAAQYIATRAAGAHVVKAFNVHPADHWSTADADDIVTIAGDSPEAIDIVRRLVRDIGATPHLLGDLTRARQLEEFAGTVISLAFGGHSPRGAVP